MKVVAPHDVALPTIEVLAHKGDTIDVPDDIGASLVEQGWQTAAPAKSTTPKEGKA